MAKFEPDLTSAANGTRSDPSYLARLSASLANSWLFLGLKAAVLHHLPGYRINASLAGEPLPDTGASRVRISTTIPDRVISFSVNDD